MPEKSSPQIPLLNHEKYHAHYFRHSVGDREVTDDSAEHFGLYNRCAIRDSIQPHRLDFFLVFLVTSGEGVYSLGTEDHNLRQDTLCFVGPNVINSWRSAGADHQGYVCSFSDAFFSANRANKKYLSDLPFFQIGGDSVLHLSPETAAGFSALFKMMEKETTRPVAASPDILRGYLQVLLGKALAEYTASHAVALPESPSGLRIVNAFTDAFMSDFNSIRKGKGITPKKISDYAKQLGVSQNHLNDTIKSVTGQSAGQLMKSQLLIQASMCLKHSTKSISEIAYLMGFEDPSYFSRYCKKQTGKLPSELRASPVKSAIDSV
jgi:AraC family transcriptional activator of pobA